ncbi:hypothetical protein [Tardiphaga sp.]|uniref:hypothetical protein n=1 Tax=Tardiphaga sp. TaxID=1926292 RepID=UPI00262FCF07|nr:hypothetical protein [Tardiphaga sp.]MDB5617193.1 hypothetical protein [Tardiphaga sp.]
MVKIVFPWLVAAFLATASAARAEPPDCNGFPDFRARITCYDAVSRAPERTEPAKKREQPPRQVRRKPVRPDWVLLILP